MAKGRRLACKICDTLPPGELVELDLVLGDPLRWPSTVWKGLDPPEGGLPASYRRLGAENMGREWLMAHGHDITRGILRAHIRNDVPVQAVSVDELLARGLIALAPAGAAGEEMLAQPIDPLAYIKFFNKGIEIGLKGLELLSAHIQAIIDTGDEVPLSLVKMIVDAGLKLSTTQATIKASGKVFGDEGGDENEAFMGDKPSPRFGSARVREVAGETRPVFDEGPADRAHYNDRAEQEGMPRIGGR